tara:strand:+ start:159 stop:599 length:441 start_codon:yes stop_codon:yes gene_type:complete
MKKIITILIVSLFYLISFSQSNTDIVGEWYTADKEAIITIFIEGKTISGTTTWMKDPLDVNGNPKLDKLNPNEELQSRKRLGLKIMQGFIFKGENTWEDGRIYKPTNGKTYGGKATLVNKNTLELKGYLLSLPFIGKTSTWTRKLD